MVIKYKINDKEFKLINSEKEMIIKFDFPISQVITFQDCFIICIEPDPGVIYNENVFGLSMDGKILWQIESLPHVYKDSPYTGIGQQGELAILCNWDGTDLFVQPYTGEIIKKSFSK